MKKLNEGRFLMQNLKFMITNFMFQVFLAVLKITPSFYCSPPPTKGSLHFHQPTPFILIPLPPH